MNASREHAFDPPTEYQQRDAELVDYQLYRCGDKNHLFRGPQPDIRSEKTYFTCIGAAQTFGCFCEKPFPELLAETHQTPVMNLGFGGAGPEFFLRDDVLIDIVNGGRFVILQVMSGRSASNHLLRSDGQEQLRYLPTGELMHSEPAWAHILRTEGTAVTQQLLEETRDNWLHTHIELLRKISVPVLLFWFSPRTPEYTDRFDDIHGFFSAFPQFVNRRMIDALQPRVAAYVECLSTRGSPEPFINRFTGEHTVLRLGGGKEFEGIVLEANDASGNGLHRMFYPTAAMHEDAARALQPAIAQLLAHA